MEELPVIFLIGYMCCGKSSLGVELAQCLGTEFVDLDDYIEQRCGASIEEIFAAQGEERFRLIEQQALREVANQPAGTIVACGGGTPCHGDNMALMNATGLTIWLTASPATLAARLRQPRYRQGRPLLAGIPDDALEEHITRDLDRRTPFYSQAHLHFDATDIETAATTHATASRLASLLLS